MSFPFRTDPVQGLLLRFGIATLLLCVFAAVTIPRTVAGTLLEYYFFHQDLWLLGGSGLALCLLSQIDLHGPPVPLRPWQVITATVLTSGLAYAGWFAIMECFPLSRDEVITDFATDYFERGHIAFAIPMTMRSLGDAMMPWAGARSVNGYLASTYMPVNSLLRAGAGLLGDRALAGPMLMIIGCAGLWASARRLWPDRADAACVALLLAVTSTQLVVTAMTPFAMTAHFALNALWIACYLRRDTFGHVAAISLGLLATGLHQVQFHILFVSGFIVWDYASGRRSTALLYLTACIGYLVFWDQFYARFLLDWMLGPPPPDTGPHFPFGALLKRYASRVGDLQPVSNLARFAAWQNILLLPLALAGARGLRDDQGQPTIAMAFAVSCTVGLLTMVYQGQGYGYRYWHGLLPCICLLAAGGWIRLSAERGGDMPARLLWIACGFALLFTMPVALAVSRTFLRPYAAAHRVLRAAPADFVLIDGRGGAFIEDLVRIEGQLARPIMLDLSYVPLPDIRRLCATSRVMVFDAFQARRLGIMTGGDAGKYERHLIASRALLKRLQCGTPVPIG
jgi:hypothetical protein